MTVELALIEHALQGLTMDVVINLTEHVQTLELRPNGQLFTAYRDIDQTLLIGYSDDLAAEKLSLSQRIFLQRVHVVEPKENIDYFCIPLKI
jgi:hypothetical protein